MKSACPHLPQPLSGSRALLHWLRGPAYPVSTVLPLSLAVSRAYLGQPALMYSAQRGLHLLFTSYVLALVVLRVEPLAVSAVWCWTAEPSHSCCVFASCNETRIHFQGQTVPALCLFHQAACLVSWLLLALAETPPPREQ